MSRPQFVVAFSLLACLATPAFARSKAKHEPPKEITSVEGITEYALSNGLHVLLFPDTSKPTITVNMTYLVGSRNEGYGETGMAHLLEHLTFKGSKTHPNVPEELTSHGARPNGTTNFDRTNYFETFAATDENLAWALDLEAGRMSQSFIAKKDLDTEMTVVRNEFESGENDPSSILQERTMSTAFLWHNYGKSTIGARSDIENVPIDHLQAFWRRYYQPDNAVLVVSGRFDPKKALDLINQKFSPIPKPTRVLDRTYTREPTQDGERSVTLRRVGDVQVVSAAYHIPSGTHPDEAALTVLAEVLGSSPSGRLYKALVETKKASSVDADAWRLAEPGVFYAEVDVRQNSSLSDARDIMLATLDAAAKQPVSAEEVERAKATLLKNIDLTLTNPETLGLALSDAISKGDWRLYFLHRDRLRKVTPEDVQRVAAAYLKPSNRTVGEFIPTAQPDRAVIPEALPCAKMLEGYKGDPPVAQGEAFDPSPTNIESRTTRTKLPFGMQLALLPKKTRGATVFATLSLRYGDEQSLMNRGQLPAATASMLLRGTTKHTRQQLRDELDRLKARVTINNAGTGQVRVTIETLRENLPAVLSLVTEVLRSPTFPQSELDSLKQEWLADLENQRNDPASIAFTSLSHYMFPYPQGDVRYIRTIDEQIATWNAVTRDDIVKFYNQLYGASSSQLSIVGDFDPAATTKLVTQLLGDWKSPTTFTRVPSLYFDVPAKTFTFQTPDKENAVFLWGMNLALRDDDPDFPAMVLGNYMIGGGFLNSRLATRIRQKEGISYGVGSWYWASALDKVSGFGAQAIYAPQNLDRLKAAFDEEITRVLKDGFTEKEVAAAKSGYLQSRQVTRAQDASLVGTLTDDLFIGRTLAWDQQLEKRIAALTPGEVRDALRRHVSLDKLSRAMAGDFAKGAKVSEKGSP